MDAPKRRGNPPKTRQSIGHISSQSLVNISEKQNATVDLSTTSIHGSSASLPNKKKMRGKSLGPGGLEALKETDGNTVKNPPSFQPRSILKPTVPLTPPKNIPTFDELRQRSTKKKSPANNSAEALLIDFSTPGPSENKTSEINALMSQDAHDPFSPTKGIVAPGKSNTEVGSTVDDEKLRQEHKKLVLEQRAARRKSMANRRVSFAPEATLHTWSVMELVEDSTTSSASNSTRRQSSIAAQQTPHRNIPFLQPESDLPEPGSNTVERVHAPLVQASPVNEAKAHLKKRRQSAALSEDASMSSDGVYSSSPSGDIAAESSPIRVEDSIATDSDSDTDGDTAMSIEQMTQNTTGSQDTNSSTHSSLEERLRQAATQAGTRGIEYDEYGDDASMDIVSDTVTNAFQPWIDRRSQDPLAGAQHEGIEALSIAGGVDETEAKQQNEGDETQGMTMEMTQAVGNILTAKPLTSNSILRKPSVVRRRSSLGRRQSLAPDSSYEDESMDLTTVAGGILSAGSADEHEHSDDALNEDVTMDFTSAVGVIQRSAVDDHEHNQSVLSDENDVMDMTMAVGGILAPIEEQTEPQSEAEEDQTIAMEITRAVGHILPGHKIIQVAQNGQDMTTQAGHASSATKLQVDGEVVASTPKQLRPIASETGSPSLAVKSRSSGRTRTPRSSQAATPSSSTKQATGTTSSHGRQTTPDEQLTPTPTRAKTPERTPVSNRISTRGQSPKKLFRAEIEAKTSLSSARKSPGRQKDPLFKEDDVSGHQTPRVVLHAPKPHQHLRRRSSGIGIDREGFGSPNVTQILSRRSSIGDTAAQFKSDRSQTPRLRFEDPVQLAEEVDIARAEDERRESGRLVMEQEANPQMEENATFQLKDMIESMTPKKAGHTKLRGRKSLAVGSARGLLGKRPAELDDNETDPESTPKRLKAVSRESSPVKKIHLPKPPTKEETTGRLTKAEQIALDASTRINHTPVLGPSSPGLAVDSPQHSYRYKDALHDVSAERPSSFENKLDNVIGAVDPTIEHPSVDRSAAGEDKISLQHFLNMTNIHFIELNTTKRRHTLARLTPTETPLDVTKQSNSLKECFVAAATTMPLLELYQHATRELKTYISTGRKIIRSIESETLLEQPPLFREYVDARPDVKLAMDNQFRNGKTNARLQSKEGWYAWRTQLVDGLRTGLDAIRMDMGKDRELTENQAKALAETVPRLKVRHTSLTDALTPLRRRVQDFENIDHQALKASRRHLRSVNSELEQKRALLQKLQQQMREREEALLQASELKEEMQQQIDEANRIRAEHHGWDAKNVHILNSQVIGLREQTGWSVLSAEEDDGPDDLGVALTMKYKNTLRLFFYHGAYGQPINDSSRRRSTRSSGSSSGPTAPISLTFSPSHEDDTLVPQLPIEQRFILQFIQSQLHTFSMMPKGSVATNTILDVVSSGWEMALRISEEIRLLSLAGVTRVSIRSDEKLVVKLMLVLPNKSRVDVEFSLFVTVPDGSQISVSTSVSASASYGTVSKFMDAPKTRKVETALVKEVENRSLGDGAWVGAVHGFEEWFRSQMHIRKQPEKLVKNEEAAPVSEPTPTPTKSNSAIPKSPAAALTKERPVKRSPLAAKKPSVIQKRTIPVALSRQEKLKPSHRELPSSTAEPTQAQQGQEMEQEKENWDLIPHDSNYKAPAITPEMQEAMMQRTPIKRVGALRRSPI